MKRLTASGLILLTSMIASCAPTQQKQVEYDLMDDVVVKVTGTGRAKVQVTTARYSPYSSSQKSGDFILPTDVNLGKIYKGDSKVSINVFVFMLTDGDATVRIYRDGELCGTGQYQGIRAGGSTACDLPKTW